MGCTEQTLENYRYSFGQFARLVPDLPVTPEPVEAYLAGLGPTPEYRYSIYLRLNAFYAFLQERGIAPNVMLAIRMKKPPEKERRTLRLDELQKLLGLPVPPMERAIFYLLATTSIRATEACTLTDKDLFPGYIVVLGKGRKQRRVPISRQLYDMLAVLGPGRLFHRDGKPMTRDHIYYLVQKRLREIGVTGVKMGPHVLRHSSATLYLAEGGDVESLRQKLGHKRLATTQIYSTMSFDQVKVQDDKVNLTAKLEGRLL